MLGDPYATVLELETRLNRLDDGSFASILDSASRAVEHHTVRQFNTGNAATPRAYDADDCEFLAVDDFHTTDDLAIDIDGTAVDVADVDPRPLNGIVNGQAGWPFFQLWAVDTSWPLWSWHRIHVTVTAQWGWAAVPQAIKDTTLNVAATLADAGTTGSGGGPVKSEAIDGYSVSYVASDGSTVTMLVSLSTFSLATPYQRKRYGVA